MADIAELTPARNRRATGRRVNFQMTPRNHNRIIVEQLHGHWSAWWEHEPQIAFGGATPAEAVDRLVGFVCTRSAG